LAYFLEEQLVGNEVLAIFLPGPGKSFEPFTREHFTFKTVLYPFFYTAQVKAALLTPVYL